MEIEDQTGQVLELETKPGRHGIKTCIRTQRFRNEGLEISYNSDAECINLYGQYDSGFSNGSITMNVVELLTKLGIQPELLEQAALKAFQSISNRQAVIDAADKVAQLRLEEKTDGMDEALDNLLDAVLIMR